MLQYWPHHTAIVSIVKSLRAKTLLG